jgi:hypothetical protein
MWNKIKNGHTHNDHCQTSSNYKKEIIVTSFSWVLLLKCKAPDKVSGFFLCLYWFENEQRGQAYPIMRY